MAIFFGAKEKIAPYFTCARRGGLAKFWACDETLFNQEMAMDQDVLIHEMTERFQELYAQALGVLEEAPDGAWISASENAFRDGFQKLMTESYETALKNKVARHPTADRAAFSPSGQSGRPPLCY